MIMVFFYGILASSLNLTVGYVGELPLGHAAFLGIGAYTSAILSVQFHVPFWLALPVAGVIAALFGLVIGAITLRLEGHYFVLITLRSEEHTSELQSLMRTSYAVFCLKKKTNTTNNKTQQYQNKPITHTI